MDLQQRLRSAREQAGLTRAEVEERAGLPSRALERWERGKGGPDAAEVARWATAVGLTVEAALGGPALPLPAALDGLVARYGLAAVAEHVAERVGSALREKS